MISLMVFEANYKKDDIVPLLRPELMIKCQNLMMQLYVLKKL